MSKHLLPILLALPIAGVMIGFALWQRFVGPVDVPQWGLFVAAAVICVAPVVMRLAGHVKRRV